MNKFPYSLDNKRYQTFNYYLKQHYQGKVAKVMLDYDFTCPNRDGTKGYGGCSFCSLKGSGDANQALNKPLMEQYRTNKAIMDRKWPNRFYIPYFQSFSNTYGPLEKIKAMLEPFRKLEEVAEIAIATRCDCLPIETVSYLNEFCHNKPIWIELGLQTSNDQTGFLLNRGYDFKDFLAAVELLSQTNIKICVHIINGLPYETEKDMLKTVDDIARLPIHALKIHMLHLIKGTKLAEVYQKAPFPLLSKEEYISIVVQQLRHLPPHIVIERLTGDPIRDDCLAPDWLNNKTIILNDIDKMMAHLDVYQGDLYAH